MLIGMDVLVQRVNGYVSVSVAGNSNVVLSVAVWCEDRRA